MQNCLSRMICILCDAFVRCARWADFVLFDGISGGDGIGIVFADLPFDEPHLKDSQPFDILEMSRNPNARGVKPVLGEMSVYILSLELGEAGNSRKSDLTPNVCILFNWPCVYCKFCHFFCSGLYGFS